MISKHLILAEIQKIFKEENCVLIAFEKELQEQIVMLKSELSDVQKELAENKAKISYKHSLPYLSQDEYDMLQGISKSKTKSEIYRKYFHNSSPYDLDSWKIVQNLEDLHLVEVIRGESSAVKSIKSLV